MRRAKHPGPRGPVRRSYVKVPNAPQGIPGDP